MRTKSRVWVSVAMAASLTVIAAPVGAQDDVDLRMTIWSANPAHVELFEQLGDEFAAASPTVADVTIESFNLADLDTLFTTQIAAGDPPDLGVRRLGVEELPRHVVVPLDQVDIGYAGARPPVGARLAAHSPRFTR